ncbi:MAG: membrane protein insertion efficiency factor YidD [Candidatus Omnitrophota bacterium]
MKHLALALIRLYQRALSPFIPAHCRFYPSCSYYAYTAIQQQGLLKGMFHAVKRILKCNPLHDGGIDYPPSGAKTN